jgi:TRAP-type C4-dicarboxylate transport system permease large subunit
MFVWMGFLAYYSGIGTNLYIFAYKLLGHLPGAWPSPLRQPVLFSERFAVPIRPQLPPWLQLPYRRWINIITTGHYPRQVLQRGSLGVLIPPSVIFILYGMATEQSVGTLFMAGIFPGILLMFLYMAVIYLITLRKPQFRTGRSQIKL